jgi:hypothetical protein
VSHLSLDAFGDLDAAAADPHVLGCPECGRAVRDQRSIRDLLAGLPGPGVAPPDVVDRIDRTLRDLRAVDPEAGGDAGARDDAAQGRSGGRTVVPLGRASARRRLPGWLAAAAGLLLVAGGGYGLTRPDGDVSATAGRASSAPTRDLAETAAPRAAAVGAIASGTNYDRDALPAQVARQLSAARSPGLRAPTGPLADPVALDRCVSALAAGGSRLVLADIARFEGKPAGVLVLQAADGTREVWVVAPTCRPGADGTRYYERLR